MATLTRERTRTWLIIATICYVPAGLVTLGLAPFMVFLYDSPDADGAALATFFWFGITLWITTLVGATIPWVFYFFKKHRVAAWITLAPVVHVAGMVIAGTVLFSG